MNSSLSAVEALQRLREGNERFVHHVVSLDALLSHSRRAEQAFSQKPIAIILGCSDSRAPAEFVFDQGLGDLFVIRVAGNIAAPSQIGSIEFAVERFGIKLVVVLGHSNCGAVRATIEHCRHPVDASSGLHAIVDRISPAILPVLNLCGCKSPDDIMPQAVRANVCATVNILKSASLLLEDKQLKEGLLIVGADYDLINGKVDFFHRFSLSKND